MENKAKALLKNAPYLLFFTLYWGAASFFEPYLSLFLDFRGLNGAQIGGIHCALYVITLIASFFMGYLSDKTGRPKLVLILTILGAMAATWFTKVSQGLLELAIACVLYGFFTAPATDLADKIAIENTPNAMRFYGIFRMGGSVGYCIGTVLAGAVIASYGFLTSMDIYILTMFGCLLTCLCMKSSHRVKEVRKNKVPLSQIFKNPKAYYIYGCMAFWGVVGSGGLSYASIYVSKMGYDTNYTATLIAAAMLGQMLMFLLVPYFLKKLGKEASISTALVLLFFRIFALTLCRELPLPVVLILHLIGGSSEALMLCAIVALVNDTFSERVSSTAQTLKSVASKGIGSSLGTLAIGVMFDHMDAFWVMMLVSLSCLAFASIAWIWHKTLQKRLSLQTVQE